MTSKFPTRKLGEDGKWILEEPPVDSPAEIRAYAIKYWRGILTHTFPDGRPGYSVEAREQALQKLEELGEPVSN